METICSSLDAVTIILPYSPNHKWDTSLIRNGTPVCSWLSANIGAIRFKQGLKCNSLGSCSECPRTYIRQTGRSLDHHIGEHRRALKNGDVTASAVAEHVFISGHQMDLSKARVVDAHPHTQTRCLLESWHIQHEQAPLNRGRGTMPGLHATLLD